MRILDRYIIKSALGVFLLCLFTFLFLYIVIDILSHLDDILKLQVEIRVLAQYYLSYLPIIFVQVAPFSCLLATLYTFSRLNRDNEIIAMRASGVSIFGVSKTVIIFGLIISVFIFWVNDRFVPSSLALNQKIKSSMESADKSRKLKEHETIRNLSMYGLRNSLFFVNKFSPSTNTMEGIIILEHDERQNIVKKIVANKGVYQDGKWVFYHCITYYFDANGQMNNEPKYSEEEIMFITETPQEFLSQRQRPDLMTISELNDYIWKLSKSGATSVVRSLEVDLYQRYTAPLISIVIILLGIPFSLKIKRHGGGISSLGVSIILAFLYYVFNAVSIALGKSGVLTPVIAVSLSHILALTLGFYLLFKLP